MHLYLNSFGTYLHVKDEMFEVRVPPQRDGEAEVPAQIHQFAAAKVRSIVMTTAGALSTDAVRLALRHNVDIVFSERSGQPLGRVWHSRLGSTTRIRKRQLAASLGPEALRYTRQWVGQKLQHQVAFLKDLKKHRAKQAEYLDGRVGKLEHLRASLDLLAAERVDDVADTLRGLEGTAGRLYFETLSHLLPAPYRFAGRSSRPALDAFNAFLNYGYGVLYARTEKSLMLAGLDPYVGFLHRDDYNQKSMVYDFIEPYRAWV
ncbi:MAG: CRISPR-associated endonuclease Cas1, partial [Catalinimonas sp.]